MSRYHARPIAHTATAREIRIVEREGKTFAFYRFVNQKSPVWRSVGPRKARAALAAGFLTHEGFAGPCIEYVPPTGETTP